MSKRKIILFLLAPMVIFITLHEYKFSVIPAYKVPKLLSSMRAKEFCTCYFLLKKGEEYCLKSVLKGYPKFDYIMSDQDKTVKFENPVAKSVARVKSKRLGCQLVE
jgi:hypothetical protein